MNSQINDNNSSWIGVNGVGILRIFFKFLSYTIYLVSIQKKNPKYIYVIGLQ